MLLLHIAYSEEDAAARNQFAFGQYSHAACLYVFEIHRKKSHPLPMDLRLRAMDGSLRTMDLGVGDWGGGVLVVPAMVPAGRRNRHAEARVFPGCKRAGLTRPCAWC